MDNIDIYWMNFQINFASSLQEKKHIVSKISLKIVHLLDISIGNTSIVQ